MRKSTWNAVPSDQIEFGDCVRIILLAERGYSRISQLLTTEEEKGRWAFLHLFIEDAQYFLSISSAEFSFLEGCIQKSPRKFLVLKFIFCQYDLDYSLYATDTLCP